MEKIERTWPVILPLAFLVVRGYVSPSPLQELLLSLSFLLMAFGLVLVFEKSDVKICSHVAQTFGLASLILIVHTFFFTVDPTSWKTSSSLLLIHILIFFVYAHIDPSAYEPGTNLTVIGLFLLAILPGVLKKSVPFFYLDRAFLFLLISLIGFVLILTNRHIRTGIVFFLLSILSILLLQNRSSIVILAAFLPVLLIQSQWNRFQIRKRFILLIIIVTSGILLGAGILVVHWTKIDPYGTARVQIWLGDLEALLHYPFGVGLGHIQEILPQFTPGPYPGLIQYPKKLMYTHNTYLSMFLAFGFLGGFILLFLFFLLFRHFFQHGLPLSLKLFWGVIMVWGLFHDIWTSPVVIFIMSIIGGITLSFHTNQCSQTHFPIRQFWSSILITAVILSLLPQALSLSFTQFARNTINKKDRENLLTLSLLLWKANPYAYKLRAQLLLDTFTEKLSRGNIDPVLFYKALSDAEEAFVLHPLHIETVAYYANLWGKFAAWTKEPFALKTALEAYRYRESLYPYNVLVLKNKALLELHGDMKKSMQTLEKALTIEPSFAEAHYILTYIACKILNNMELCVHHKKQLYPLLWNVSFQPLTNDSYGNKILSIPLPSTSLDPVFQN